MKHSYHLIRPDRKTSSIRLVVSHGGKKYPVATGLVIETALWNKKAKTLISKCKDARVRDELLQIDLRLCERERTARTERDVLAALDYALGKSFPKPSSSTLWAYFEEWANRDSHSRKDRLLAYKRIGEIMGKTDNWSDIDGDWVWRFTKRCNELGYSQNYKSTLGAKFRTMMKEAYERGIHTNEAFHLIKTPYKTADTIALTQEEVDALWGAELTGKEHDARDCFIVGVYCAGRFQDYSKLSEENIVDGKLRYVQRKTGATVLIPLSPRIAEVFARNGGKCPAITEQELGRHIKNVCRKIGGSFDSVVEVTRDSGGVSKVEKRRKWELVSPHTARRTSISILHKSGVPLALLMSISGHSTLQNIQKYIKANKDLDYELLAKIGFFK